MSNSQHTGSATRRILVALATAALLPALALARQQTATFRSGVDLVAVDAQVLDRDGGPIGSLGTKDFQVWINGQARQVISVDQIKYPLATPINFYPTLLNDGGFIKGDAPEVRGRIFVLVVDELSFSTAAMPQVLESAKRFLSTLAPEDVIGIYAYPFGPSRLDLTHYHTQAALALSKIQGLREQFHGEFNLMPSEAVDITANNGVLFGEVVNRECKVLVQNTCVLIDQACPSRIKAEANGYAQFLSAQAEQSFAGLRGLLHNLSSLSGPKTVVLLSAGLMTGDIVGSGIDVSGIVKQATQYAAAADASLYVLHMDGSFQETFSPMARAFRSTTCSGTPGGPTGSQMRDGQLFASGLQRVAGEAGGAYFRITAGNGDLFFNRVLKETSTYYLLGVQPQDVDRDGRVHYIRVKTDAKGATVRARQQVTIPRPR